jgi:hypothetical protein
MLQRGLTASRYMSGLAGSPLKDAHCLGRRSGLRQSPVVEAAMATAAQAVIRTLAAALAAIKELETALDAHLSSTRTPRSRAGCPDSI